MNLLDAHCIVIKIGSSLLVDENQRAVNHTWLSSLVDDVSSLIQRGKTVILVSSGAVALGRFALNCPTNTSLDSKQAASAVGQIQLMNDYHALFLQKEITTAQILLTLEDTENRRRYINLRNTFKKLMELNVLPIVNENDSVSTSEICYGDNDRLSARIAQMVDADALILLSDIDGFYTDDPSKNKDATLIPTIENITPNIQNMAKNSSTNYGSGGMITKLDAARIATQNGCHLLITSGKHLHPITRCLNTKRGTWFQSKTSPKKMKKLWLQEHLKPAGSIVIDEGAVDALKKCASLLPVGIVKVNGDFSKGSAVTLVTQENKAIACGLTNYSSEHLNKLAGKQTKQIEECIGFDGCHEAIHRDNLVIY